MYQDERRLDFRALGREIKRKREAKGWTQEYLAQLVDRTPRSICLMLRKKLFTVFAGLVLFKGRPCLGILHRCRLQFRVGMEGDFGAFDLVRQLVKTLCCRRGLLLQLLIVRQAVVLQVSNARGITIPDRLHTKNTPLFCCACSRIREFSGSRSSTPVYKDRTEKAAAHCGLLLCGKRRAVRP